MVSSLTKGIDPFNKKDIFQYEKWVCSVGVGGPAMNI